MTKYNLNSLIEQVKYGDAAPAYGGDLKADLLSALDDIEQLRDLVELYAEAFPKPADFDPIGQHLISNPKAGAAFAQLVKEWHATQSSLRVDAESLSIEIYDFAHTLTGS